MFLSWLTDSSLSILFLSATTHTVIGSSLEVSKKKTKQTSICATLQREFIKHCPALWLIWLLSLRRCSNLFGFCQAVVCLHSAQTTLGAAVSFPVKHPPDTSEKIKAGKCCLEKLLSGAVSVRGVLNTWSQMHKAPWRFLTDKQWW